MKAPIQLGLRQNWKQFTLLVIVNAFVGGMVGLERTIIPQIAEVDFGLAARAAILSFIVVFGISKAITNYYTGRLADVFGRRRLLITGWLFAIPVPVMLMRADSWTWVIAANILLGINQGLTWSSTVVMKIDLVGEKKRGFAMGINEFAGYVALAAVAYSTGWIAHEFGLRPYPFYLGIAMSVAGLAISVVFVRDTQAHVQLESTASEIPKLRNLFWDTSWRDRNLGAVTQAGLINNLNDGMVWGLFPLLLSAKGFNLKEIGIIAAVYPAVWGVGQLITGSWADKYCKRTLLFTGMLVQGVSLLFLVPAESFSLFVFLSALLGVGTAMVYPTFLAAISEHTHPQQRAQGIGIFRLWRDLGYALGAILTGVMADRFGLTAPVVVIGILTIASGLVIRARMKCG